MEQLIAMIELQTGLNVSTNGDGWVNGITKNGKKINWQRCIYMECAEMIDSFAWKHWKSIDKEADWANLQIEVVDVWHFIISLIIEQQGYQKEAMAKEMTLMPSFEVLLSQVEGFAAQDEIMLKIEEIMLLVLQNRPAKVLTEAFFDLVHMSNLNLDSLYKLYVGKNILNQFRQDHGYKDGSYVKIWSGVEDNVVMQKLLEPLGMFLPSELYDMLEKEYVLVK